MKIYYNEEGVGFGHERAPGIAKRKELGKLRFGPPPFPDVYNVSWKPVEVETYEQGGMKFEAYEGEVKRDDPAVRHGRGICFFQGLHLYEGWWKDGLPFGKGRFIYFHGQAYEGGFTDVKRTYDGWIEYKKHGRGKMYFDDNWRLSDETLINDKSWHDLKYKHGGMKATYKTESWYVSNLFHLSDLIFSVLCLKKKDSY